MPKTVDQIKAEVTALVKSQGDQGAISLGTVLDDLTDLAGEGGGGTTSPMLISMYRRSEFEAYSITSPSLEEIQTYATAALEGANVMVKMSSKVNYSKFSTYPAGVYYEDGAVYFRWSQILISSTGVTYYEYSIDTSTGVVTISTKRYPSA